MRGAFLTAVIIEGSMVVPQPLDPVGKVKGHHVTEEHVIEEDEEDEIDSQDDIDKNENMNEGYDEPLFDIARVNNT
ncbi:hypothetical protein Taro_052164 [Colocasia esculenta]|uniref:Uncharacterized protein n=1 Tax=Colocasia esculenta TaxID=4460 RepID=A0A843XHV8_COLES|nr:hypothetical protein [Colocasia esculenta]